MGYSPNHQAQSIVRGHTDTIMIVVPDITNAFYPELARSVQDVVSGYHTLIANSDGAEERERALLEDALTRRVDGLIFVGFRIPVTDLAKLARVGTAVVNLGETPRGAEIDSVRFDDIRASVEAAAYLIDRYGPDVVMIAGDQDTIVGQERRAGFEQALRARGLPVRQTSVVASTFTRAGGHSGMRRLLARRHRPRAVLCGNDLIAVGALDVLRESGDAVPESIAVMGHDDIEAATMVTPQLTTTRTDARELGRQAGQLLLSRMSGEYSGEGRHVVVPHSIVVRESA
jgi:LacI family transcriptional regulator